MRSPRGQSSQIETIRRSLTVIAPLAKMLRPEVEPALADASEPAASRVPRPVPTAEPDRSRIIQAVHRLRDAAGQMGRDLPLVAGFDEDVSAGQGRGFLGPRTGNHGLTAYFPELLRPLEPHFTRRLAHFLSPASAAAGLERTRAFIASLFEAVNISYPVELLPDADANLSAEAEAVAPGDAGKRRIDLLISWSDKQRSPHCLAVEAKFDAPVRPDALRAYSTFRDADRRRG
jgi:hypothetical protein